MIRNTSLILVNSRIIPRTTRSRASAHEAAAQAADSLAEDIL